MSASGRLPPQLILSHWSVSLTQTEIILVSYPGVYFHSTVGPWNEHRFDCVGPLTCRRFSVSIYRNMHVGEHHVGRLVSESGSPIFTLALGEWHLTEIENVNSLTVFWLRFQRNTLRCCTLRFSQTWWNLHISLSQVSGLFWKATLFLIMYYGYDCNIVRHTVYNHLFIRVSRLMWSNHIDYTRRL